MSSINLLCDLSAERRRMEAATCQRDVIVLGKESTKTRKVCLQGGNFMFFLSRFQRFGSSKYAGPEFHQLKVSLPPLTV